LVTLHFCTTRLWVVTDSGCILNTRVASEPSMMMSENTTRERDRSPSSLMLRASLSSSLLMYLVTFTRTFSMREKRSLKLKSSEAVRGWVRASFFEGGGELVLMFHDCAPFLLSGVYA